LTAQPTTQAAPRSRPLTPTSYAGFGIALKDWLLRADRSQKELAHFLQVNPSTVTNWVQGQKRPDVHSLVKLLAHFKGWFRAGWNPLEALDAFACLGYDWFTVQEVCARHFQKGGILKPSRPGGSVRGRPSGAAFCHPDR
jgi:transcriptional regulator with XRE-family HTH domain